MQIPKDEWLILGLLVLHKTIKLAFRKLTTVASLTLIETIKLNSLSYFICFMPLYNKVWFFSDNLRL